MAAAKTKTVKDETLDKVDIPVENETPEETTEEDSDLLDSEIERIVPDEGEPLLLVDGTKVNVRPLKLKELFAAFKIITRGAAMSMGAVSFSLMSDNQDQFAETMIALLLNAIPEADQEFCEFLRVVVDPYVPEKGWVNSKERDEAEVHLDNVLLVDPEIEDAIDIVTTVVYRESKDIQRLGKKVASAAKLFGKVAPKTPQEK